MKRFVDSTVSLICLQFGTRVIMRAILRHLARRHTKESRHSKLLRNESITLALFFEIALRAADDELVFCSREDLYQIATNECKILVNQDKKVVRT